VYICSCKHLILATAADITQPAGLPLVWGFPYGYRYGVGMGTVINAHGLGFLHECEIYWKRFKHAVNVAAQLMFEFCQQSNF